MKQKEAIKIIELLIKEYPEAKCSLNFSSPYELLVAVMLSAQCTDERVNKTTPALFAKLDNPKKMSKIELIELENFIKSCGFYKVKAKHIKEMSQILIEKFDGKVPKNMEDLVELPGVGRKSANVIMTEAFEEPQGIAVDTHVKRLSNRIGFSKESNPLKIEQDLIKLIPKKYFKYVNHVFMWHGRNCCKAQSPNCLNCPINTLCKNRVQKEEKHYAYMLRCSDDTIYSGYALDPYKRLETHNSGKGAKYTRARLPVKLVYFEEFETKSEAMKREAQFKKLTRKEKEGIIEKVSPLKK